MSNSRIPIIYYHSVAPVKSSTWYKSYLTYELVFFEDLMKYLKREKFEFLFLDEYFNLRNISTNVKSKLICLTFDDGFLDNYVYVFPLLKKYKIKATLFVSPEFVPDIDVSHNTLEQVWSGNIILQQLDSLGYASWSEMREMEKSGLVDIQSHTLTHTKYFCNDTLREFHHPKSNYLYPISNQFPDRKPFSITDPHFINLLPFGTPFFQETSALITKKVTINPQFTADCVTALQEMDWNNYSFKNCFDIISGNYKQYQSGDNLIVNLETEAEYKSRVKYELIESKNIIEHQLSKSIHHCCWPHGDYNDYCQQAAMEAGYQSTSIIIPTSEINTSLNRFDRTGSGSSFNNRFLTLQKAKFKINGYRGVFPYGLLQNSYYKIKYGKR